MVHKNNINLYSIVPAKKTSLRLKNKNIKLLNKKHLIGHVIENLKKAKLFDKIIISSDSTKIFNIASKYGKIEKCIRDPKLSDSFTGTDEVVRDVIKKLSMNKNDIVMCIYPTAVLVNKKIIISSFKKFIKNKKNFLIAVKEFQHPIQRGFEINSKNSKIKKINQNYSKKRTQDLKKFYHDAGQFYWGTAHMWLKNKNILNKSPVTYILKQYEAFDIDNEEDLQLIKKISK
jgi:pseudaminic acid cytidylyltransferase